MNNRAFIVSGHAVQQRPLILLLAAAACSAAVAATDADLERCRALRDGPARLVCYDALPMAGTLPPGAPQSVLPAMAPAAAPPPAAQFGFEQRTAAAAAGPEQVDSRVLGFFEGWGPNTRIKLENGQVWQVVDDSRGVIDRRDPAVRVARGALGSYVFEVVGRTTTARVRRVE